MKRKLSKLGRSTVSVLLCLVMLLTTFCFFDIGSMISEALVSKSSHALTEAGTSSDTFAQYNISAPELVYIKAGGKDSEYFLNATSSGTVSEPTSATGMLRFSCATSRSVTVSITVLDANLNASGANRVTNVAFSDGTYMSSDKALSAPSSSVTKTIKSISMANAEVGKEYVIRWNIVYTTASGSYTTYAYTGIKFPLLSQAGMTTRQYYYGTYGGVTGNPAETSTYSFITGADSVKGGNVASKWVSTGSTLTAPLINFNAGLYPRGLDMPINSNYFDPNGSDVLLCYSKRNDSNYFGQGSRIYNTQWDGSNSYNPKAMITQSGYFGGSPSTDGDAYGYAAADITIDTSRFSNFNQVPNLYAGFVEFDSDGGASQNYLNAIRNVSYTSSDAAKYFRKNKTINNNAGSMNTAPTIYCPDVDRSDEKNGRSWVRGLYKLDGDITAAKNNLTNSTSGGTSLTIASFSNNVYSTYIRFEYSLRFNPLIGYDEYCSGISAVRLNATLADKATARKYYSKFLNSGVNASANNWSTIEGYVKSYVKTLCVSSAAAGSYTDPASAISAAQTNLKTVMKTTTPLSPPLYFYTPEAIYLTPSASSWGAQTRSSFQWYIQNNISDPANPTTRTSRDTSGTVYFNYPNASNLRISYKWINKSGSEMGSTSSTSSSYYNTNSYMTLGGSNLYSKTDKTVSLSSGIANLSVTAGYSPYLVSGDTGCFIEWTAKYIDLTDGYEKTAIAYTYVYKPWVAPIAGADYIGNYAGTNFYSGQITWISGVHGLNAQGGYYPRYSFSNKAKGLSAFLSNSISAYGASSTTLVTGTKTQPDVSKLTSKSSYVSDSTNMYASFATTSNTTALFSANQANSGVNNNTPIDWMRSSGSFTTNASTTDNLFNVKSAGSAEYTNDDSGSSKCVKVSVFNNEAKGSIYIDTSRYTNLKDIPNLGVGLMVTHDKSSDAGAWYVSDMSHNTTYDLGHTADGVRNSRSRSNYDTLRAVFNNQDTVIAGQGTATSFGGYESEGIKYAGIWVSALNNTGSATSTETYRIKGAYAANQDSDQNLAVVITKLVATQTNKTDLRKAVKRAQNNFPNLGIHNAATMSSYYYSGTTYTNFVNTYKNAYRQLTKLDGNYTDTTASALATNLNNYIDQLTTGTDLKTNCTAREYNLGLEKLDNGQYKIVEISGGQQYEITYDARDNVYFTPDTYEGYTYIGKCELTNVTIAPSDYYGKTLASLPTFFSASNLYSNSMSYSGSTVTIGTTTVKTTTVPQFDGDTTAYEWVAAVNDTSLTMVNFYFIDQNKIYFDPNDGSSGVNLLTQPTTYKSGNNFYSPTFTSSPGNGVTATFDQTDSTFTFNGTPTTGAEYFRFPIAGKLKANTNYTYRVVYVSGSKTLDGGTLTLTLDICDKNGNRCYKASGENYSDRFVFDQTANQETTSRTLAPDAYQAANAEFVQVFTYSPSYGTVRYNNYKVKIELVESGSANQTYSPNAIQQFYGRSIGTMPVPVRDNYRFLGWFTAPDGGDRVTASSLMGSTDRTVYAHWAVTDKVLLLDNDFNFDDFVRKASNNNAFDAFMNSYKACKLPGMKNPLSYQENDYFSYSIAKDTEGDTALNVKYDRKHIVDAGVDEVFDTFKSNTYTASVEGEYTLTYEYRINDYYSYIKDTTGKSEYDSIVLGFSTNDGYWYNGGQGVSYTENRKTTDGYESVELKRTFTAGTQYFFNMIFYFAYYNNYNELRADMDIKNIVLKDPNGNIVLSSNGMNTANGTSSFDSDARTITLKPTGTDCYTNTYDNLSSYRSTLEAGKKYTLLMDYQATTATKISPFIFFYPNATSTSYTSFAAAYIQVPAGSGTVAMQFTVPANNYYQIRFSENSVDGSTVPGALTLGNISLQRTEIFSDGAYVADSSTYLGWVSKVTGSASATAVYVNDLNSRNEKIVSHYQDIDYGAQYDELYVPTREGFTFLGWYDADGTQYTDANGNAVGNHVCTTDGFKLYSRWTPKTFNLKYNAFRPNDSAGAVTAGTVGNLPTPNPQVLKFGVESSISLTAPTLTGYTFSGWSETYGGAKVYDKGQTLSASTVSRMYKDCNGGTYNIYTTWTANKYKIHFDKNATDANGSMADMDMVYDVAKNLSENKFSREGYTFQGWNTAKNGSGTSYDDKALVNNLTADPNGTVTLYAQWTANVYTITFLPNGGSVNPTSKTFTIESTIDLPTPTKDSYVFDGWLVTTAEGNWTNGTLYTDSSIPAGKYGNVTVTAQWHKTVTVHFYSGSKGAVHNQFQITFKNNETAGSVKSPTSFGTIDGWTALGWLTSEDAEKTPNRTIAAAAITGGTSVTVTPAKFDYNYYAIYSQNQTLTYNSNAIGDSSVKNIPGSTNGTAYYNSFDKIANVTHNIPSTVPTRNGYTFASWNTEANGSGVKYNAPGTFTNSKQNEKLYAQWTENKYTITYSYNGSGTADKSINYTITSAITIEDAPTYKDHVFAGWKIQQPTQGNWPDPSKESNAPELYGPKATIAAGKFGNVVFVAQWVYINNAENKSDEYTLGNEIEIVTGVESNGTKKTEKTTKYDKASFDNYTAAIEKYRSAKALVETLVKKDVNSSGYSAALKTATKSLQDAITELTEIVLIENGIVTKYYNNFYVGDKRYNLSQMNLNHYEYSELETAKTSLINGKAYIGKDYKITATDSANVTYQSRLNECVLSMAKAFISTSDKVKTSVGFKVYETVSETRKVKDANENALAGDAAVNYVYAGKDGSTYYCYTNSTNPVVLITVDDGIDGGRKCYPTKAEQVTASTTTGTVKKTDVTFPITKDDADSKYVGYINAGVGKNIGYYRQKQVIRLAPEFEVNLNGTVTYEFTAHDDTLSKNVATQSALSSGLDSKKANDFSENLTASKTIKIVIDYHAADPKTGEKLDVNGDQVSNDVYLNQFHLYRNAGGAKNWELPRAQQYTNSSNGNTYDPYIVDDGVYGQKDYGSFSFTFKLGNSIDLETKMTCANGNVGYVPTLNTTDASKIAQMINNGTVSFAKLKSCEYTAAGEKPYYKRLTNGDYETETVGGKTKNKIYKGGTGYGFIPWPKSNIWSFNYYPENGAYTYVHLVDRWGNTVDKVIYVGLQDPRDITTSGSDGIYTILEDGGSGIDTLSLNAGTLEILTDENSTLENNVYRTTGNTVRIKTGEANKSYTLSMKDKATNASTATLKSDGNGIITLSVEDTAYKSGVYTFMLNGTEINLYDGVNNDKYILNVYDGEAEEGESAEMIVITTGEVGKTRFTDTDGNTVTVAASETNEDGTKTWRMSKSRPAGEYEYRISVKVGHDWIEENRTGKLIFTEKQLDTGRIVKAEYDKESGFYRLTIEGRATKIQFITEDGMTRTYTRYSEAVKSRKSYDAEGNEVPDTGRLLDHEVWLVNARLYSGQNYTVAGKFEAGWNREGTATLTGH